MRVRAGMLSSLSSFACCSARYAWVHADHRCYRRRRHGRGVQAHDTRLDRTVAIKVLPSTLVGDAHARQRFAREARAIAALSHPAHLPALRHRPRGRRRLPGDGVLEGESLATRLAKSRIPLEQAMRYAMEVAALLGRARRWHRASRPEAGQHHPHQGGRQAARLRPGEAAARSTGHRPHRRRHPAADHRRGCDSRHAPVHVAGAGRGRDADARSDIFALGAVVYEMLAGRGPSMAGRRRAIIAAILCADPPPPSSIVPSLAPSVDYFVRCCLAKNPDDRWQSAHDVLLELRSLEQDRLAAAPPETAERPWRRCAGWIAARSS